MHETFTDYLERKSTGISAYKAFAKLAIKDDSFYGPLNLANLMDSITKWDVSEAERNQYMTDCARAWINWQDSERRIREVEYFERRYAQDNAAAC